MVSGPLIPCCFLTASLAAVFVTNWALVARVVSGFDVSLIKVLAMWPGTVLVNGKRISKKKTWMWSLIFWVKSIYDYAENLGRQSNDGRRDLWK
jgi:hypothetical protein